MTCNCFSIKWYLHIHSRNHFVQEYRQNNMGHTTEGACEGEAGVMWNLPSSILHICRVHGEHMLEKKRTHRGLEVFNSSMWAVRQNVAIAVFSVSLCFICPFTELRVCLRTKTLSERRGNARSVKLPEFRIKFPTQFQVQINHGS